MMTVATSLIYLDEKFYNDRIKAQKEILPEFHRETFQEQEQALIKTLIMIDKGVTTREIAKILDDNKLHNITGLLFKTMEYCHKNDLAEQAKFWTIVYDRCTLKSKLSNLSA